MKRSVANLIRLILMIMLAATLFMSVLWMPNAVDHFCALLTEQSSSIRPWLYAAATVIALPLFAVFIIGFEFPTAIEGDTIFSMRTAKLLRVIATLLFSDLALFAIGVIALFVVGDMLLAPALAFVLAIGITVSLMLCVLASYVENAAVLKEEADGTL